MPKCTFVSDPDIRRLQEDRFLRLGGLGRGFAIVLAVESIDRSMMATKSHLRTLRDVRVNTITQCKVKISPKAFVAASEMQPLMRLRKLLANNWIFVADVANKSKRRQHGGDRDGRRKCESCLAVVLNNFVSFGEGTERGDFLELVIPTDSYLGWTPYQQP